MSSQMSRVLIPCGGPYFGSQEASVGVASTGLERARCDFGAPTMNPHPGARSTTPMYCRTNTDRHTPTTTACLCLRCTAHSCRQPAAKAGASGSTLSAHKVYVTCTAADRIQAHPAARFDPGSELSRRLCCSTYLEPGSSNDDLYAFDHNQCTLYLRY